MKIRYLLLIVLLLTALGLTAQMCKDYTGQFDETGAVQISQLHYGHIGTGNHNFRWQTFLRCKYWSGPPPQVVVTEPLGTGGTGMSAIKVKPLQQAECESSIDMGYANLTNFYHDSGTIRTSQRQGPYYNYPAVHWASFTMWPDAIDGLSRAGEYVNWGGGEELHGTVRLAGSVVECAISDSNCAEDVWSYNTEMLNDWYDSTSLGQSGIELDYVAPISYVAYCPALSEPDLSPIVIPLKGGNYAGAFTDLASGVTFDFFDHGSPVQTSWIADGAPYGFLVLPSRGVDGVINSSKAMFGNLTRQRYEKGKQPQDARGFFQPNGFNALEMFDVIDPGNPQLGGNGNGVIDPGDLVWQQLRVWEDTCHCGDSRLGKLWTLDELGITQIDLKYHKDGKQDSFGNQLRFKGSMVQNGKSVAIYDVYFVQ